MPLDCPSICTASSGLHARILNFPHQEAKASAYEHLLSDSPPHSHNAISNTLISQSSWELTRYEHRDTSNDNPMESGLSGAVSKGTCTPLLHCKISQLLAPKGLLLRLSLLKIKAKACAHVLLDTDLRKWKDIFLSVECFLNALNSVSRVPWSHVTCWVS